MKHEPQRLKLVSRYKTRLSRNFSILAFDKYCGNYSARTSPVALAPIKGRLCRAKQGGKINYSPKILHLQSGYDKQESIMKWRY